MKKFSEKRDAAGLGAAITVALHVAAGATVLAYEPARSTLLAAAPIRVDWIAPPAAPTPEPKVQSPKPRPVTKRPPAVAPAASLIAAAPAPKAPSPIVAPAPPPAPPEPLAAAPAPAPAQVTPPVFNADYLQNPAPSYPAQSRRMGEQGRVILRVLVSAGGTAEEVELRSSSGFARLDEAARETVKRWKFHPARRGTQPVPAWVLVPINFTLES